MRGILKNNGNQTGRNYCIVLILLRTALILLLVHAVTIEGTNAQTAQKIPLTHSVYDSWKKIDNPRISGDGKWIAYEVNPQKGDGWLYIANIETGIKDSVPRGYESVFSPNSDFLVFKIKPQEAITRKAKLDKKKKEEMPKDSLGIWLLEQDSIIKVPELKSFFVPIESESRVAYLFTAKKDTVNTLPEVIISPNKDTTLIKDTTKIKPPEKKEKKKKKSALDKIETYTLTVCNPLKNHTYSDENVTECAFSKNGSLLSFITLKKDTIDTTSVKVFDTGTEKASCIFKNTGLAKNPGIDRTGGQVAFIHSADTAKVKRYQLFCWKKKSAESKMLVDTLTIGLPDKWEVSESGALNFSDDATKLFFRTSPKVMPEPKDTLTDDEKVRVDIWNWQDPLLQSQQLKEAEKEKKRQYLAVYHLALGKMVQLADTLVRDVDLIMKGNGAVALGTAYKPYQAVSCFEDDPLKDIYVIDVSTGEKKLLVQKTKFNAALSAFGNYLLWYDGADSSWYSYSLKKKVKYSLTKNIPVKFYDEENNVPTIPAPYGGCGWTANDEFVLLYDRYDIWKISPDNKVKPENITATEGRKRKTEFRYIKLDAESIAVETKMLLKVKNDDSSNEGFYTFDLTSKNPPARLIVMDNSFSAPVKAKKAGKIMWCKYSYREFPDLWISNTDFTGQKKMTNANPQQEKYFWGTVETVSWKAFDGQELKGLLYKPDNFDTQKKYPMIVYFYEKNSDNINIYYYPNPSRSIINFPYYNSNGYVIFVPDIVYKTGHPGEGAYNCIVSGAQEIIRKGFVDSARIGIQGHSWGGYQAAYLITRTNMFKAAAAGAAVTNMTSAYTGIRLESGICRVHQYEMGQSRIGGTLWEKQQLYVENSPVFYTDKIATPLLMMNNDNDGAVPWQQGLDLFIALKRLNKPAWLLNYNGEEHNLSKRPARMDFSIRLSQFFDYYLKDASMPLWMSEGIPAVEKGLKTGYDMGK